MITPVIPTSNLIISAFARTDMFPPIIVDTIELATGSNAASKIKPIINVKKLIIEPCAF